MAQRYYTTLARLRNEGLSVSQISDSLALGRIRTVSGFIDRITGQYFAPRFHSETKLTGRGSPFMTFEDFIPILKVDEIAFQPKGEVADILDDEDWVVHNDRILARNAVTVGRIEVSNAPDWTDGYQNYRFKGWTGWLEDRKEIEVELTQQLSQSDTEIHISNAEDIVEGDYVTVKDASDNTFSAMINSVDYGTNILGIDAANTRGRTFPIGTPVFCFGRTPDAIVWACTRMAVNASALLIPDSGGGSSSLPDPTFEARLKSEKTDNYSYTLFSPREMNAEPGQMGQGEFTGDPKVDLILASYVTPTYALSV